MSEAETLKYLLRKDFCIFVEHCFAHLNPGQVLEPNWHIELLCWWAEQVRKGGKQRIIVALPPRSLKSIIFSVAFPAFLLGHNPSMNIVCASHNADLAEKLSLDCRKVMMAPFYLEAFPKTRLSKEKNTAEYFETTMNGSRRATSPNGGITGMGADVMIVDDLVDAKDAHNVKLHEERYVWLQKSLFTRTNRPNETVHVIVGQRLSIVDFMGKLIASGDYETLAIPAIAPQDEKYVMGDYIIERPAGNILHEAMMDEKELKRRRRAMTAADFAAQYQQEPISMGGGTLSWSLLKQVGRLPPDLMFFQSWDIARTPNGGDYTACVTIGYKDEKYYIVDIFRKQIDFNTVMNVMRDKIRRENPVGIIIETRDGAGSAAWSTLQREGFGNLFPYMPSEPKQERVFDIIPVLEGGDVYILVNGLWVPDFRIEYLSFPSTKEHDDQLDALAQGIFNAPAVIRAAGGLAPRKYFNDVPELQLTPIRWAGGRRYRG